MTTPQPHNITTTTLTPATSSSSMIIAILAAIIIITIAISCIIYAWVKKCKNDNEAASSYLQMENLVASSPIVQPPSSDTFHTTSTPTQRTTDWERQVEEGRRLIDIPTDTQDRITEGLHLINLLQNPVFNPDEPDDDQGQIMITLRPNPEDPDDPNETVIFRRPPPPTTTTTTTTTTAVTTTML